jgi:hypothetical protein
MIYVGAARPRSVSIDTETHSSLSDHLTINPLLPQHQFEVTIGSPGLPPKVSAGPQPLGFSQKSAEKTNLCCLRLRWNKSKKNKIIQAIKGPFAALTELVKKNPTAAQLAAGDLEGRECAQLNAVRDLLKKPGNQIDPEALDALQNIINNVFGNKIVEGRGFGWQKITRPFTFEDVDLRYGLSNHSIVAKAVIHGYALLKTFAPSKEHQVNLRNEMIYRICLVLERSDIKKNVFGDANIDLIEFLIKKCHDEDGLSPSDLYTIIDTSEKIKYATDGSNTVIRELQKRVN